MQYNTYHYSNYSNINRNKTKIHFYKLKFFKDKIR
jgi:hypothetical protein